MREKTESPRPALAGPDPDEGLGSEAFRAIDRMREALSAKMTGGISPAAVALAYLDLRHPDIDWRNRHPALQAYAEPLFARPAFVDTRPPAG